MCVYLGTAALAQLKTEAFAKDRRVASAPPSAAEQQRFEERPGAFVAIAPAVLPRIEGREQNARPRRWALGRADVSLPRGCRLPRSALGCFAPRLGYRRPLFCPEPAPSAPPPPLRGAAAAAQQPGVCCPAPSPPAPRPRQIKRVKRETQQFLHLECKRAAVRVCGGRLPGQQQRYVTTYIRRDCAACNENLMMTRAAAAAPPARQRLRGAAAPSTAFGEQQSSKKGAGGGGVL